MGVFYRPPGLSSTMELPFTILQKVKKFYKPDHPTIPHHLLMDLYGLIFWVWTLLLYPPCHMVLTALIQYPTIHTLPHLGYTLDQYATHPWLYACHWCVSLGLTPKNLCVRRIWHRWSTIIRPPTGGQLAFKRYSRRRPLPILTITYHSVRPNLIHHGLAM